MYWINLLVMKYKCPIPAAWNLVELMYAVETFGLLNCTCSYGMTLCKCSGTPSMSRSCGLGLPKFFSQLPSDRVANWNSKAAHTSHRPPNFPDMVNALMSDWRVRGYRTLDQFTLQKIHVGIAPAIIKRMVSGNDNIFV